MLSIQKIICNRAHELSINLVIRLLVKKKVALSLAKYLRQHLPDGYLLVSLIPEHVRLFKPFIQPAEHIFEDSKRNDEKQINRTPSLNMTANTCCIQRGFICTYDLATEHRMNKRRWIFGASASRIILFRQYHNNQSDILTRQSYIALRVNTVTFKRTPEIVSRSALFECF